MKHLSIILLSCLLIVGSATAGEQLEIGDKLPKSEQTFKDVSGKDITAAGVAGENGLLVIFTCNTCPYVLAWEDRYPAIAEAAKQHGIGLMMVNPNEARRTTSDSYDAMVEKAKESNYDFYYAMDNNHQLADALGATKTPDVFLFDSEMMLKYKGAIDDNYKDASAVQATYLSDAMTNMFAGETIDPNATKAIGCSIKRVQ